MHERGISRELRKVYTFSTPEYGKIRAWCTLYRDMLQTRSDRTLDHWPLLMPGYQSLEWLSQRGLAYYANIIIAWTCLVIVSCIFSNVSTTVVSPRVHDTDSKSPASCTSLLKVGNSCPNNHESYRCASCDYPAFFTIQFTLELFRIASGFLVV